MLHVIFLFAKLAFATVVVLIEGTFWLGALLFASVRLIRDAKRRMNALNDGVLHCSNGHSIETEGGVYRCEACGFTYSGGSIWSCANSECGLTTSFVNCATCGLSVRNPYRWMTK